MTRDFHDSRRPPQATSLVLLLMILPCVLVADEKPAGRKPARVLLLWHSPDGHPRTTHEYQAGMRIIARQLQRHRGIQALLVQANDPWPEGLENGNWDDGNQLL